jgi:hypothetical protein
VVPPTPRNLAALAVALGLLGAPPASAGEDDLSIQDARRVATVKVKRLEDKLRDTGATGSGVPGCWRESKRRVGCLGMVRGADAFVRWRCAVPMTVRKRSEAAVAASGGRRLAVEFTDTMCAF